MIKIRKFEFNPFQEVTYLLVDDATNDAVVVDPGMFDDAERREFDDFVEKHNIHITQVVNTHLHIDHCISDNYVRNKYGVKVAANIGDEELGRQITSQAGMFGLAERPDAVTIDVQLKDGDTITVGQSTLKVIEVAGHSPGGIALYSDNPRFLISGDSLFKQSIGRADLPGGNIWHLVGNIKRKLFTLPDDTVVFPGHGPSTTIGFEKVHNPHFQ